jgi:protein SCO1/2
MKNKSLLFFIGVVLCTGLIYKGIAYFEATSTPLPVYGNEGHIVPEFEFTNQLGETISSEEIADQIWVVDFFFTSCPTICPKMTRNLQSVHDIIRNEEDIKILSFTVDPKRDTPERLKSYAEQYRANHDSWYFLTGDKTKLYRLGNKGFLISATEAPGDELDFIHSENIVLVDRGQKIRGYYKGTDPASMKALLNDINKLKRNKA